MIQKKNEIDIDSLKKDRKEFIRNNKLILQTQQKFNSERQNVFTEAMKKIALRSNNDKNIQSIDSYRNIRIWNKQSSSK